MPRELLSVSVTAPETSETRRERKRPTASGRQTLKVVPKDDGGSLVWRGPDYPMLEPGRYMVRCVKMQGPQWVRCYARWSLRLEFALTTEPGVISAFFNFGNDRSGPRVGRQSRYYKAWVLANGEHPRKGQVMSPETFLDGQFFEVEVESCNRDAEGAPKPGGGDLLPRHAHSLFNLAVRAIFQSFNQESRIRNHPNKQSTNQVAST